MAHHPGGKRTVRSATGHAAAGLRREAALLRRARHPGVIELVEATDDGDHVTVVTATPEGVALARSTVGAEELAGVVAVLSTTVADLHDIGIAHGAIDGDHVIVGGDGRPVLIGFEAASIIEGPEKHWPTSCEAQTDVDALGELAARLLGPVATLPDRRLFRVTRRRLSAGPPPARPVAAVVAGARSDRRQLGARDFADVLLRAVPEARLPGGLPGTEPTWEDPSWPEWPGTPVTGRRRVDRLSPRAARTILAALAATVAIAVGFTVAPHHSPGRPLVATVPAAAGPVPAPTSSSAGVPAAILAPSPATVPDPVPPPTPVDYVDGVLRVADRRFRVGQPGDLLALGRWRCNGTETLALARPKTTQIWLFSDWPTDQQPLTAREIATIPGATALRPQAAGRCDELIVDRSAGPPVVLLQRPQP